jgi:uncharacterized protein YggT (Ycf19 family)
MSVNQTFFAHWYFHVPNFLLAAAIYTLIGRYVLSLFFGATSDRVILRVFATVTDPILRAVASVTPRLVPPGLVLISALVWLLALRMALFLGFALAGFRFTVG